MAYYGKEDIKKGRKSNILTTQATDEKETIDVKDFEPDNGKGVTITSKTTFVSESNYNLIYTSEYADTITAKNGNFNIWTKGNKGKKITTGKYNDTVHIDNNGKNTINLGNGNNDVIITGMKDLSNTITTGVDNDDYTIRGGKNFITDKGGNNKFTLETADSTNTITSSGGDDEYKIDKGKNKIADKGGKNTFEINSNTQNVIKAFGENTVTAKLNYGGKVNLKTGKGADVLNIINYGSSDYTNEVVANLGNGENKVKINSDGNVLGLNVETTVTTGKDFDYVEIKDGKLNKINTGKGSDSIVIKGGAKNIINSGDGEDTIVINNGNENIIKAGKNNDEIIVDNGNNKIYGENGKDIITIKNGYNDIYGGSDKITVKDGSNFIYSKGDTIELSGGNNVIYNKSGNSTITAMGGNYKHTIYLEKGNNTVSVTGEDTSADIRITKGKNTITSDGASSVRIDSSANKTAQKIYIKGSSSARVFLGKGDDVIVIESDADDPNIFKAGAGNDKFYISAGKKQVYGENGNDYFEITGGENHAVCGEKGKDKFVIKGSAVKYGTIDGREGNDAFIAEGGEEIHFYGGKGNDTFNIKKGVKNIFRAGEGNDTFNITGEDTTGTEIWGEYGNNTFNVKGGSGSKIYGGSGKATFNIMDGTVADLDGAAGGATYNMKGGKTEKIQGNKGVDTFNITGGNHSNIRAGAGNDIFNIKGGKISSLRGEEGEDIYNLYNHEDLLYIDDSIGNNTYNIKKGYYSQAIIQNGSHGNDFSQDKYVFDKSFKLSNSKNVGADNTLKTDKSTVTLFFNYDKTTENNGEEISFIMNMKEEIKGVMGEHGICAMTEHIDTCTFNGKKYEINLDVIKEHIATWFSQNTGYSTSSEVLFSGNEADINSLMAIYTKDTAGCFKRV